MTSHELELAKVIVALEAARPSLVRLGRVDAANNLFALQGSIEGDLDAYRRQAAIEAQEMVPIHGPSICGDRC